jgi:hypothetical protein
MCAIHQSLITVMHDHDGLVSKYRCSSALNVSWPANDILL